MMGAEGPRVSQSISSRISMEHLHTLGQKSTNSLRSPAIFMSFGFLRSSCINPGQVMADLLIQSSFAFFVVRYL